MNRDDIIRLAREAGMERVLDIHKDGTRTIEIPHPDLLERFYQLAVAAEREKVAAWMVAHLYATGHGDTTEDMLEELEWQIAEREREACRDIAAQYASCEGIAQKIEQEIRERGEK
jgi:hypothetical protein